MNIFEHTSQTGVGRGKAPVEVLMGQGWVVTFTLHVQMG